MPFESIRKRKEEGDIRRAKEKAEALVESQRQTTLFKQEIEKCKTLRTRHGSLIVSVLQALKDTGYLSGEIKLPIQDPDSAISHQLIWTFGEKNYNIQVIINTSLDTWSCNSWWLGQRIEFPLATLSPENLEKEIMRAIDTYPESIPNPPEFY